MSSVPNAECGSAGAINHLFNTPELHRWHHSCEPRYGNRNYGENLMLFDLLFRT